jgi:hypothetical protein
MRVALVVCVVACVSACGGSSVAPTDVNGGAATNIAGTWNGTIVSSNNASEQLSMLLTQSGSDVSGSWNSTSVSWEGQISGTVRSSSFTGQFTFSGAASNGTVCTGTADVVGSAATPTMAWTSASGVIGGSCPAPLPIGLKIDVQRQ